MKLKCTKCKTEKEDTEFYPDKRNNNGKTSWCKSCMKSDCARRSKYKYNTDPEYRQKIREYQNKRNRKITQENGIARKRRKISVSHTINAMKNHNVKSNSIRNEISQSPCVLLKVHAIILKDDPERLTTNFLQNLIGRKCNLDENEAVSQD
jgi:hypothetical protein